MHRALQALPHGPEFRFLDRLTSLDAGKQGRGEYRVRGDEPFLRGHFPSNPMMPGVLLLEAAAQLSGVVAQSDPKTGALPNLKLTALRAVKILGSAVPGDILMLETKIVGRLGLLVQAHATASIGGHVVMQAELTLSGTASPQ